MKLEASSVEVLVKNGTFGDLHIQELGVDPSDLVAIKASYSGELNKILSLANLVPYQDRVINFFLVVLHDRANFAWIVLRKEHYARLVVTLQSETPLPSWELTQLLK